jgi:two-component system response regulator RegA
MVTGSESADENVLIIDDDEAFRERIARALKRRGYEVRSTGGGESALAMARQDNPTLAIVDLRMPGNLGLRTVRELVAIDPRVRILVLAAYGSVGDALEAVRAGAASYLQKPVTAAEVESALRAMSD